MRLLKSGIVLLIALVLIRLVAGGRDLELSDFFRFVGGHRLDLYDIAALALITITLVALHRLFHREESDE
jgi:hypothetical protein